MKIYRPFPSTPFSPAISSPVATLFDEYETTPRACRLSRDPLPPYTWINFRVRSEGKVRANTPPPRDTAIPIFLPANPWLCSFPSFSPCLRIAIKCSILPLLPGEFWSFHYVRSQNRLCRFFCLFFFLPVNCNIKCCLLPLPTSLSFSLLEWIF